VRVVTHLVFAETCWFVAAAVFDVHYEIPSVAAAVAGVLPDPTTRSPGRAEYLAPYPSNSTASTGTAPSSTPTSPSSRQLSARCCGGSAIVPRR
jgi:hypothetical protein